MFTVFVAGFLIVFQPFGIAQLPENQPVLVSIGFGLVTFVAGVIVLLFTQLFSGHFNEDNWTLGKELFWGVVNFGVVAHGNYLYVESPWLRSYQMVEYGEMVFATVAVGVIPYFFMQTILHFRKLKKNEESAGELTRELTTERGQSGKTSQMTFHLYGENESDVLELNISQLLYIQSAGNYIEVVYQDGQHISKSLLRSTLSNAESSLMEFDHMFRCHRTYLVNLESVSKIIGNSQGYRLVLSADVDPIPVARTKNAEFKSVIANFYPRMAKA